MSSAAETVLQPLSTTALTPSDRWQALGLSVEDGPRIHELSLTLQDGTPTAIHAFGRDASRKTSAFADQLLEEVRNTDLDRTGKQLTEVVRVARSLDLKQLTRRSNLPIIGPLINRFRATRGDLVQSFSSTRQQVDALVDDIGRTQSNLGQRSDHLETMMGAVREEYREMGLHIAAGEIGLAQLRERRAALATERSDDPTHAQRLADLSSAENMLDKRIADLRVLQQAALQSMPTIRLIQAQNALLQDKFENIKELTIPAWKRQFVLQMALTDQKNAAELSKTIDDTTNEMMRASADLLHQNAVATAQSNQRLVIDVDTLKYVHTKLIETLQDVSKANSEGLVKRREAEVQLLALRKDMQDKLTAGAPAQLTN